MRIATLLDRGDGFFALDADGVIRLELEAETHAEAVAEARMLLRLGDDLCGPDGEEWVIEHVRDDCRSDEPPVDTSGLDEDGSEVHEDPEDLSGPTFVPELGQRLAILDADEAQELVRREPGRWNVISISDPDAKREVAFPRAQGLLRLSFHDVEAPGKGTEATLAGPRDINRALTFARRCGKRPLLIHCHAGISRSPALAWVIYFDRLNGQLEAGRCAFEIVARLRPCLNPNRHVLRLGIAALIGNSDDRKRLLRSLEAMMVAWTRNQTGSVRIIR